MQQKVRGMAVERERACRGASQRHERSGGGYRQGHGRLRMIRKEMEGRGPSARRVRKNQIRKSDVCCGTLIIQMCYPRRATATA